MNGLQSLGLRLVTGNMNTQVLQALVAFAKTNSSAFVSFIYENEYAISRYTVHLGTSIRGAYERGLQSLIENRDLYVDSPVQLQAIDELIASVQNSLQKGIGNNDAYTKKDKYTPLAPNLKIDTETGKIYLSGFVIDKVTITQHKPYKTVNSSEKTLAKNAIRERHTKLDKFRDFILDPVHFGSVSVNKNKITINSQMVTA